MSARPAKRPNSRQAKTKSRILAGLTNPGVEKIRLHDMEASKAATRTRCNSQELKLEINSNQKPVDGKTHGARSNIARHIFLVHPR
jgi:hypothetical protein